jgi:hypothetical protein
MSELKIPDDLRELYDACKAVKKSVPGLWIPHAAPRVIELIERIARLEQERDALRAQLAGLQTLSDSYKSNYGSALDRERIHLAQLAAVTAPVTDEELSPYSASGSRGYMLICSADVTELIAARLAQVPTNGPCSVCGDGDGKGYCPVHNPGVRP